MRGPRRAGRAPGRDAVAMLARVAVVAALVVLSGCASTPEGPDPWTRTLDRPIQDVPRRTIGFLDQGVWISNEMPAGRLNDVWLEGDSLIVARIEPENDPINDSAWYAFKVWADAPRTVALRLTYEDGRHRYWPEARRAGEPWTPLPEDAVTVDSGRAAATLRLPVGPDTLWVAGQELFTSTSFRRWTDSIAALPFVEREVIGTSRRGRPIEMLTIGENPATDDHVLLISRQHPPELTGTVALLAFVHELTGDTPLARDFRRRFQTRVVPVVNPDGVDLGHWRHNTGGVDLNRDWIAFHQPETRAVRDALLRVKEQPGARVWFAADFHSTRRDVFYTLEDHLEQSLPGFLGRWLDGIRRRVPGYDINEDPSGLGSPTSRNWFYREFDRVPSLTYEVGDRTDRGLIREVAQAAARSMMELLLAEVE